MPIKLRRKSKYGNKITTIDGITFDSKKEAQRWFILKMAVRAGQIQGLERQVPIRLEVNGHLICKYIADFIYFQDGKRVVEDVKGVRTAVYRLKAKMLKALLNIDVRET